MNYKQRRFALEYAQCGNATKAAERAGYSPNGARTQGSIVLADPEVQAAIAEHERDAAYTAGLTKAKLIREIAMIAFANPNEIMRVDVRSCPRCYSDETRKLLEDAGLGDSLQLPAPKCALCGGHGVKSVWLADTSRISESAQKLISGIRQTKDGIEVKLKDQSPYIAMLGKILGVIRDQVEVAGPGGGPIQIETNDPRELSEAQLELYLAANMGVDSGVSQDSQPLTLEGSTA